MLNTLKKYFQTIFGVIFIITFSFYFGEEYLEFYEENKIYEEKIVNLEKTLNDFSLEKIEKIKDVNLHYTPNKSLLDEIVLKIKNANSRIYLNTYIFTEKRIRQEIINAKKRGLDVKVILEKNLYKAHNINNKTYGILEKNDIDISWSNPNLFVFDHAKYFIIDDEVIISTGNISYSTFTKNRDFFVFIKDKEILKVVLNTFSSDFNYKKDLFYHKNLVLSPNYSRDKLESMVKQSKKSLKMYFQYLYDDNFISLLKEASKKSVVIEIIVRESFYIENQNIIKDLESSGVKIYPIKKPQNHSKAILVDNKYLFIGSINISDNSMDNNRELGIIFNDKESINKFNTIFNEDIERIKK